MIYLDEPGAIYANERFNDSVTVRAPWVRFSSCRFTPSNPDERMMYTGLGTILDHCTLCGSPAGQRGGIRCESAMCQVINTVVMNVWHGNEAQAISGDSGTAQLVVEGCYLEAAGEVVMFGGSDPVSEAAIPQDILIRNCTLTKPLPWRNAPGHNVKNLFELKNAKRVLMEDCNLSYSWVQGQTGYGVLLNVRNQNGTAPYSTLEDITLRRNVIRACAGGIQMLGKDYSHPSQLGKRWTIEDNRIELDPTTYGGNGRTFAIESGPEDLTVRRNTSKGAWLNSFLYFSGDPMHRFVFEHNDCMEGAYGAKQDGGGMGTVAIEASAPGYIWTNNIVRRTDPERIQYPIAYPNGTTVIVE